MLEAWTVSLKIVEKEDLSQFAEMISSPSFVGEYNPLAQMSKTEMEKAFEDQVGFKPFFVEKKDGSARDGDARERALPASSYRPRIDSSICEANPNR